jgi:hypothetical protein
MDRDDLRELHYITPIANVESILERGILSHARAAPLRHVSIAAAVIQDRREGRHVPGGRPLHDYANLYFHARNPMMWVRRDRHAEICVLRVGPEVIDLPGAVVTSQNASSDYALFRPASTGLGIVDDERVFAQDWRDPNQIEYYRKKSMKCAEVLIPDSVSPDFIRGAYCSGDVGHAAVASLCGLDVTVDADLFFRGEE